VNWNILVTSGKEIKRDSMISVNESRRAYILLEYVQIYSNNVLNNINWIKTN
jgi:hypothetical protein